MVRNVKNGIPSLLAFIAVVAVIVGGLVVGVSYVAGLPDRGWDVARQTYATSSSTPEVKVQIPIDLGGVWESDNPKASFIATITDTTAGIVLRTETGTLSYWNGSFVYPTTPTAKIQSVRDTEKANWSSTPTKEFTYVNGTITFEYSGPGFSKSIVLHRR